jgi:hypothetical protein
MAQYTPGLAAQQRASDANMPSASPGLTTLDNRVSYIELSLVRLVEVHTGACSTAARIRCKHAISVARAYYTRLGAG